MLICFWQIAGVCLSFMDMELIATLSSCLHFYVHHVFICSCVWQDLDWLRGYMPTLRRATSFLYDMIDEDMGLARVPGALMIDVFLRSDFASDTVGRRLCTVYAGCQIECDEQKTGCLLLACWPASLHAKFPLAVRISDCACAQNAMLVGFFREFADAEEAVGDAAEAERLRNLASTIAASIDKRLWSEEEDDHFITQIRADGSRRDMVDYDANLMALAHGVTSQERAARVFRRLDNGHLTHVAPTFVSERYYGAWTGVL